MFCEQATKELDQLPVPDFLSNSPSEPGPGDSRGLRRKNSVLARLPSLQGKQYTPEVGSLGVLRKGLKGASGKPVFIDDNDATVTLPML